MRLDLRADLETKKAEALAKVDQEAEAVRLKFITPGSGQAMTYSEKRVEAQKVLDDPAIDAAEVPHIAAEAALNGLSNLDQAIAIMTVANQWTQASVAIEMKRMAAKTAIRSAGFVAAVREAADVDWSDILSLLEP